jgi:GT2 family glycosyltransferase
MNVAAVIVSHNGAGYIEKCLHSFTKQKPAIITVTVVDDCSKDDTISIVKNKFPEVRVIANEKNIGYAGSLNRGIAASPCDYIVLSNDDIEMSEDWLNCALAEFGGRPECGLVASKVLYMDQPDVLNSTGMLYYKDLTAVNRGLDEKDTGQYDRAEEVFGAYGAIMLFKRDVFEKIGLFEEDYFLFREEDEIIWRMRLAGYIARYAPKARVFHKRSAHTKLFSTTKLYYSERNRIWNVVKFLPWRCLLSTSIYALFRYYINFRIASGKREGLGRKAAGLKGASKMTLLLTIAKAWIDAFAGVPRMAAKRFRINKTAKVPFRKRLAWLRTYSATVQDISK